MEIGIDALPLMGRGGVSRHLRDLLPTLVANRANHCYHLFARLFRPDRWAAYHEAKRTFADPRLCWHRIVLADRLLEFAWTFHDIALPGTHRSLRHLDVFLATAGLAPAGSPCPIVGIVHDLVPLRFPHWFSTDLSIVKMRLEKLCARSRLLIAVSESTGRDLQEFMGVSHERIRVIHHGIHPRFMPQPQARVQVTLAALGITGPYFLYVGGLGPVKNVHALLEAFRVYHDRVGVPHTLLLVGDRRWAGTLPNQVDRLRLSRAVRFLDFVDNSDMLSALYTGATALVLPSWYESFGFPALEAMACGTPVLASRVGALPEILAETAVWFSPDDSQQLAEHMIRISTDGEQRMRLGTCGRKHAAGFTWENAATKTLQVLEEAAGQAPLHPHV